MKNKNKFQELIDLGYTVRPPMIPGGTYGIANKKTNRYFLLEEDESIPTRIAVFLLSDQCPVNTEVYEESDCERCDELSEELDKEKKHVHRLLMKYNDEYKESYEKLING